MNDEIGTSAVPFLADAFLGLYADMVNDAEANRIANQNRLRHLTRHDFEDDGRGICERCGKKDKDGNHNNDKDGIVRGLGLDETHPEVATLSSLMDIFDQNEHRIILELQKKMRSHPLGPWVKAQKGVGDKQAARLLALIGDPYVNANTGQVRNVGKLWAYCGHGDPARKKRKGMSQEELFALGSPDAKMRVHLIAESCLKQIGGNGKDPSPYRVVYDERKAKTVGRVHKVDCVRCGPSGHPAKAGSPWSDAHRHADALRIAGKAFLKDLWIEARRLHQEQ